MTIVIPARRCGKTAALAALRACETPIRPALQGRYRFDRISRHIAWAALTFAAVAFGGPLLGMLA